MTVVNSGSTSSPHPDGSQRDNGAAGDSIVLEEEIDPNYVPTKVISFLLES